MDAKCSGRDAIRSMYMNSGITCISGCWCAYRRATHTGHAIIGVTINFHGLNL